MRDERQEREKKSAGAGGGSMEAMRLNRYLAACGVCSRREADRLIGEGRVTVNAEKAVTGMKVTPSDELTVNGRKVQGMNQRVALAYYKPRGVTCTEKDRHADRKINDDLIFPVRVTYAGRLDKDSEGLLLMTNDGELIDAMMRGANGHEKEYQVRVDREITEEFLKGMEAGVYLKELEVTTGPCRTERTGKFSFAIILTQGVNRQIRRMCKTFGYEVKTIKRTRVMNVGLANLKPGEYRPVQGEELRQLYNACGIRRMEQEKRGIQDIVEGALKPQGRTGKPDREEGRKGHGEEGSQKR